MLSTSLSLHVLLAFPALLNIPLVLATTSGPNTATTTTFVGGMDSFSALPTDSAGVQTLMSQLSVQFSSMNKAPKCNRGPKASAGVVSGGADNNKAMAPIQFPTATLTIPDATDVVEETDAGATAVPSLPASSTVTTSASAPASTSEGPECDDG